MIDCCIDDWRLTLEVNGAAGLQTGRVRTDLKVGPSIAEFCNPLRIDELRIASLMID
jgi:hypothetical protein